MANDEGEEGAPQFEEDCHDDEAPTVVVLGKGDLSQEQVDKLKEGGVLDEEGN